jgi:hypothetical protein
VKLLDGTPGVPKKARRANACERYGDIHAKHSGNSGKSPRHGLRDAVFAD